MSQDIKRARAQVATNTRHHGADAPETIEAKRSLKAAKLEQAIAQEVDAAPPLTVEQKARLTRVLWGSPTIGGLYNAVSALADEALRPKAAR